MGKLKTFYLQKKTMKDTPRLKQQQGDNTTLSQDSSSDTDPILHLSSVLIFGCPGCGGAATEVTGGGCSGGGGGSSVVG